MKEFTTISKYVWIHKEDDVVKEDKTDSGLFLTSGEKKIVQEVGIVASIGVLCDEKVQRVLNVGDTVLFEPTEKGKIVSGHKFLLVPDYAVLAKL